MSASGSDDAVVRATRREKYSSWLLKPTDAIRSKIRGRSSSSSRAAAASDNPSPVDTPPVQAPALEPGSSPQSDSYQQLPEPTKQEQTVSVPVFITLQESSGHGAQNRRAIHKQAFEKFQTLDLEGGNVLRDCTGPDFQVSGWQQKLSSFMQGQLQRAKDSRITIRLDDKRRLVLGDLLEKASTWVKKIVAVGDIAVSYDPTHAALPWAGFRFLLQSAISYQETQRAVWNGTESICKSLAWIYLHEQLFLDGSSQAERLLIDACVEFHVELFIILAKYIKYFRSRKLTNVAKAPLFPDSDHADCLQRVEKAKVKVKDCSDLVVRDTQIRSSKRTQRIHELLAQIDAPLQRIQRVQDEMFGYMQEDEQRKTLDWISRIPYIEHYNKNFGGALNGTGKWLLYRDDFKYWKESSTSQLLRIHGPPGSGKTTLLGGAGLSPIWFFCLRSEAESERADPVQIIRCLIRQLSIAPGHSKINSGIVSRFCERDFKGQIQPKEFLSICKALIEVRGPTFILIDALDECEANTRGLLLDFLADLLDQSSELVKIFVTSRDDRQESIILKYPEICINAESNAGDIESYITHELDRSVDRAIILEGRVSSDLRQHITDQLLQQHGGIFRWVALQLQRLKFCNDETEVRDSLKTLPNGLFESYYTLYTLEMTQMRKRTPGQYYVVLNAFKWLLIANRQLSSDEFCFLVGHRDATTGEPKERRLLIRSCFSLVEFDSNVHTFRFCHLSVREFFEHEDFVSQHADFATKELHSRAATQCLDMTFQSTVIEPRMTAETDTVSSSQSSAESTLASDHNADSVSTTDPEYWMTEWAYHTAHALDCRHEEPLRQQLRHLFFSSGAYDCWLDLLSDRACSWVWGPKYDGDIVSDRPAHPLMVACRWGLDEYVLSLANGLELDDMNNIIWGGQSMEFGLVERAAAHGHEKVLRVLFDELCMSPQRTYRMLNARDSQGDWPYAAAHALCEALQGGFYHLTWLLVENGVEVSGYDGVRPLALASAAGRIDLVEYLLEKGAFTDLGGYHEASALTAAVLRGRVDMVILLLNRGANVNAGGLDPNREDLTSWSQSLQNPFCYKKSEIGSPLTAAIQTANFELMQLLLERGADIQLMHPHLGTALEVAAGRGDLDTMRFLLRWDAHVNLMEGTLCPALSRAAHQGHIKAMQLLLDNGARVNQGDERLSSPLSIAAGEGRTEAMKLLFDYNATVNQVSGHGLYGPRQALTAAAANGHVDAMGLLLENDAEVNGSSGTGQTPLNAAVLGGHHDAMTLLLENGAQVNREAPDGGIALVEAARRTDLEAIKILLDHHGEIDREDEDGWTPLLASMQSRNLDQKLRTMQFLLANGANVDRGSKNWDSPLMAAAKLSKDKESMRILLENGADVNKISGSGQTVLHKVLTSFKWDGMFSRLKPLLDHGACANATQKDVKPPLLTAIADTASSDKPIRSGDRLDVIQLLIERGAEVNAVYEGGGYRTALEAAVGNKMPETVQLLLGHGAIARQEGDEDT